MEGRNCRRSPNGKGDLRRAVRLRSRTHVRRFEKQGGARSRAPREPQASPTKRLMPITNARLRKAGSCAWLTFLAVFAEALGCGSQALKSLLMSYLVFYQGGDFARMVQVASADEIQSLIYEGGVMLDRLTEALHQFDYVLRAKLLAIAAGNSDEHCPDHHVMRAHQEKGASNVNRFGVLDIEGEAILQDVIRKKVFEQERVSLHERLIVRVMRRV